MALARKDEVDFVHDLDSELQNQKNLQNNKYPVREAYFSASEDFISIDSSRGPLLFLRPIHTKHKETGHVQIPFKLLVFKSRR